MGSVDDGGEATRDAFVHAIADKPPIAPPSRSELDAIASKALLERLAWRPRFAGSATEAQARQLCTDKLRAQGFEVTEESFTFSEFPGKWAPSISAIVLAVVAVAAWYATVRLGAPISGMALLVAGIVVVGVAGSWTARYGTARIAWLRSQSVNLIAIRGTALSERPRQWLVAHIDSKSQNIPMLVRIASVVLSAVLLIGLACVIAASAFVAPVVASAAQAVMRASTITPFATFTTVLTILACTALLPLIACFAENKSQGALDNSTGVAAVLMAVRHIDRGRPLGVIITSGEELGLAGARAFANANPRGGVALNCDTIDDRGEFLCMSAGGQTHSTLQRAVASAVAKSGTTMRCRRMLPGVMADNIAFTDAGWDSLTLTRGNLATLARVHTSGDRPDEIDGSGIAAAAALLAATIEELE